MKAKLVTVAALALLLAGLPGVAAEASTGTPLDCPGIVAAKNGYRLTQDTTCDLTWAADNTTLHLGGHTLTGTLFPTGHGQTVRSGTLVTGGDYWASASDFRVSHLSVRPPQPGGCLDFCIEAADVTIEHSTFRDIGGIALSFYFGSNGSTIRGTDFLQNRVGVSIQGDNGLLIENNRFIDNDTGLNLWTEDATAVSDNTIRGNLFRGNRWGLRMRADDRDPWVAPLLSHNRVTDNRFAQNEGSGLLIETTCYPDWGDPCDLPLGNTIDRNHFWRNGAAPAAEHPAADDGVTARGIDWHDETDPTDNPSLLAGFTLARNRAHHNGDLGFDVAGVTDGRGNRSWSNTDPAQCLGLPCQNGPGPNGGAPAPGAPAVAPPDQLAHG